MNILEAARSVLGFFSENYPMIGDGSWRKTFYIGNGWVAKVPYPLKTFMNRTVSAEMVEDSCWQNLVEACAYETGNVVCIANSRYIHLHPMMEICKKYGVKPPLAECFLEWRHGIPVLIMERVRPLDRVSLKGFSDFESEFLSSLDKLQAGYNSEGKLVAYDYNV